MTVDELIEELKQLRDGGRGHYQVVRPDEKPIIDLIVDPKPGKVKLE